MNFVAIDFETANEMRNSPCSIGIVVVKNGKVTEKVHHLIKPKEMRFMPINIGIHGIRASMVENELEFDEVWEKIKKYFNNSLVIAHNAAFDISVLRKTLELYNIEAPSFNYICTMKISRNYYNNLVDAKLNTVNNFLGYRFNHHDALADALACSNILLNISKELNITDINEISKIVGVTVGNVNNKGYTPSSTFHSVKKVSNRTNFSKNNMVERFNSRSFENEVVVFTGRLVSMSRGEAMDIVRRAGGLAGGTVTKKTTMLVTNSKNIVGLRREEMSTKYRKAMDYKAKGQDIKIINEEEFLRY